MRVRLASIVIALLLAGCGDTETSTPDSSNTPAPVLAGADLELPLQSEDFPVLASRDCGDVASFYREALEAGRYAEAALVWDDPVIDAARIEAALGSHAGARIELGEPSIEGAAGSLYCTVEGSITNADGPEKAARDGTLVLRRANDVPGASADQLRWTLQSSTFVEKLERSSRG